MKKSHLRFPLTPIRLAPLLLVLAALAPALRAQASLAAPAPTATERDEGLLGQTYSFLDFNYVGQHGGPGHTGGPTLGANLAVGDNADVTMNFSYARQTQWPDDGHLYQLGVDTTVYARIHGVKPFLTIGLGYQSTHTTTRNDFSTWEGGAGVEVVVAARTSLLLKALRVGSLQDTMVSEGQYSAAINRWLSANTAVTAMVLVNKSRDKGYTLGLRRTF